MIHSEISVPICTVSVLVTFNTMQILKLLCEHTTDLKLSSVSHCFSILEHFAAFAAFGLKADIVRNPKWYVTFFSDYWFKS